MGNNSIGKHYWKQFNTKQQNGTKQNINIVLILTHRLCKMFMQYEFCPTLILEEYWVLIIQLGLWKLQKGKSKLEEGVLAGNKHSKEVITVG